MGVTGGRGGGMYQPVYAPFSSMVERDMNVAAAPLHATPGPGAYAVPAGMECYSAIVAALVAINTYIFI